MILLLACAGPNGDSGAAPDTGAPPAPFVDPLDPDSLHVLACSSPAPGEGGHALTEVGLDLTPRWNADFDPTNGASGAVRLPDGNTTVVRVGIPPVVLSALDVVDSAGTTVSSDMDVFGGGFAFAHGLEHTPDGDYIIADVVWARVFAVSPEGEPLWDMSFTSEDGSRVPNGITLMTDSTGVTRLGVTALSRGVGGTTDSVQVYRLGARTDKPTLEWRYDAPSGDNERLWPHGPRFVGDTLYVNLASRGQIAGFADGVEQWRVPPTAGILAFPRDVLPLSDGTWLVADAARDVLRIRDPLGAFEVVNAGSIPGVFSLVPLDCATMMCLDDR